MTGQLLNTPAEVIRDFIIAAGFMTDPSDGSSWPLYISSLPDGATNAGVLMDAPGWKNGRLSSTGLVIEHYGLVLKIRSRDYNAGFVKIEAMTLDLDEVDKDNIVVGGQTFELTNISRVEPIKSLGTEPESTKRRFFFESSFLVTMKNIT